MKITRLTKLIVKDFSGDFLAKRILLNLEVENLPKNDKSGRLVCGLSDLSF